jgi:hypothetical protein
VTLCRSPDVSLDESVDESPKSGCSLSSWGQGETEHA